MLFSITHEEFTRILVQLITAGLGTLGFAIIYKTSPKKLHIAMLGGMLTYAMYETVYILSGGILAASFCSALVMAIFSEVFARIMKAPAILFLFACLIPIVPGNALYNTMYSLLSYNEVSLLENARITLETVLGIAVGLGVASIIIGVFFEVIKLVRRKIVK